MELKTKPGLEKRIQKADREREEEAKLFKVDDFLAKDRILEEIVTLKDGTKIKVRYGKLALGEYVFQTRSTDNIERGIEILCKMLQKADSTITIEKLKQVDGDVATAILDAIGVKPPLETSKESAGGLTELQEPRSSAG